MTDPIPTKIMSGSPTPGWCTTEDKAMCHAPSSPAAAALCGPTMLMTRRSHLDGRATALPRIA
jgi:hypothetical protein